MGIFQTYANEKLIEQYRNEEKCAICGHERIDHKYETKQCPANDPYLPKAERKFHDTTYQDKF